MNECSSHFEMAPEMAPFSRFRAYNPCTTQQPAISKSCEISVFITPVASVLYKNLRNCERFQCPFRGVVRVITAKTVAHDDFIRVMITMGGHHFSAYLMQKT